MPLKGLQALERMSYPGRVIIIGQTPDGRHDVVVYAITGRSPSSRARRLVHDGGGTVRTEVTDPDLLPGGSEKLLIYRCLRPFPGGLAVSNGAQTDLIWDTAQRLAGEPAADILRRALDRPHRVAGVDVTAYEPDAPAYTPRISGCLANDAALAIVRRRPGGDSDRQYFDVPPEPGKGRLLATYGGQNRDPLPSFDGDPAEVSLAWTTPQKTAEAVFQVLGPEQASSQEPGMEPPERPDLRVGVAVLFRRRDTGRPETAVINRTADSTTTAKESK
jgi:IMP cyclohydrolase